MLRRTFLAALAALPVIGRVKREETGDTAALVDKGNVFYSVDPAVDKTVYVIRCVWNPGPLSVENCRFVPWKGVSP